MQFSFYLACIYGLQRETEKKKEGEEKREKKGEDIWTSWKVHLLLYFYFLQFLVSAHLRWNVLEYYLNWTDH